MMISFGDLSDSSGSGMFQVEHFEDELAELKQRSCDLDYNIGTCDEILYLRTETEKMQMYSSDIKKTVQVSKGFKLQRNSNFIHVYWTAWCSG